MELSQRLKRKTVEKILIPEDQAKYRDLEIKGRKDLDLGDDIGPKLCLIKSVTFALFKTIKIISIINIFEIRLSASIQAYPIKIEAFSLPLKDIKISYNQNPSFYST